MKKYAELLGLIGNTPIVELKVSVPKGHRFLAKLEYLNPGGSVKDRIAAAIIDDAEKRGALKPGGTIVEATSGNTGVGLALVAGLRGYKCVFAMPDKISEEKRAILRGMGATVLITPVGVEADDPRSHYSVARKYVEDNPNSFLANQYNNPANVRAHFENTGPEIWRQTEGEIDVFVAGAGTGGTISGVGRFLKSKRKEIKVVCADPIGSILYDMFYFKEVRNKPQPYLVEGIGEDMVPENMHFDVWDDVVQVTDKESFSFTRKLSVQESLLVGPSSGAAVAAAVKYSEKLTRPSTILIMIPDSGRAYLSKAFNEAWLKEKGLI